MLRSAVISTLIAALLIDLAAAADATTNATELFESKVRPVFVASCQKCHGSKKQEAGLRLDSRKGALTGGDSGPAIKEGDADKSELIKRITDPDDDLRMPPANSGKRLSDEQVASIKQWIKLGAPWPEVDVVAEESKDETWRKHWAFQSIRHPEPPEVGDKLRVVNPIDLFVLAKLEAAGLQISPEADRRTLIRRATYDLTGLPPTPQEVADFVNDSNSDAYGRLVDRLLDSPRYGEQWGRYWLDIARYADTKGYVYPRESLLYLNSAPYRDWVISAFNKDLPYNRFVTLQLAADQAAPHEPESLAAMGFLTLGRRMLGVTPDIIEDRIDMVGRGLLGLTVGCARCHDHKYDPIPTADFYSLYGVFQNCAEYEVPLPNKDGTQPSQKFSEELSSRQQKLAEGLALRRNVNGQEVRARIGEYLAAQQKLEDYSDLGVIPVTDQGQLLPGFVRRWEAYLREAVKRNDPVFVPWGAYAALAPDEFASRAEEINKKMRAKPQAINARVAKEFATAPTSFNDVIDRYARLFSAIDAQWKLACANASEQHRAPPQSLAGADDEALRQVLYGEDSPCKVPDEPIVNTEYLWTLKRVEQIWKLQSQVDDWVLQHPQEAQYAVVLRDRDRVVDPQIFRRGNPMNKGDTVPRQFLAVAAGPQRKPFQYGSGRYELAQAIIDPANPFTSRVWVNRVWLNHFGKGLVTTPSDFGIRSSPPSHPDLLDWLASEFMQHGWSTKWLHRTIMLSSAYRQSSTAPDVKMYALAQERDPENRLLWRMNRRRLSFEQYRDTLIANSGELDKTMGGKGVNLLGFRRTVYAVVDRQYLPTVYHVFDFASPDFHSSQRAETTTPQQALFALNNPYVADRARKIAAQIKRDAGNHEARVREAYQLILQRTPTHAEVQMALDFLRSAGADEGPTVLASDPKAWSYGYGRVDTASGVVRSFHPLPHFTGSSWQGGPIWPDTSLGWVRLTAKGGHPGNDDRHTAIRRWTASAPGVLSIKSIVAHQDLAGDGVRCWIVSSKDGVLAKSAAHNERKHVDVDSHPVTPGETIDFVVDYGKTLESDEFVWIPTLTEVADSTTDHSDKSAPLDREPESWNSENGFTRVQLLPLEQFVQSLLVSNEVMFVD